MPKLITLLVKTGIFNDDIREWKQQSVDLKTWAKYNFFPPMTPRAENSGNNRRKGGVQHDSAKHLRSTTALSKRALWGDQRHTINHEGNVNTRLRSGRTVTSQFSPYQLKICGNGKVGIDECNHEHHSGETKNTCLYTNQPSKEKKKVLLLDLRDQFHSREKNLLRKESKTSRGSVLQEKDWWQWKGMWMTVRVDS